MDYLYHYTSLDALIKIIQSGTLWATDYKYLNDSSEFQLLAEKIEGILDHEPFLHSRAEWKFVIDEGDPKEWRSRFARNFYDGLKDSFVGLVCFSQVCDDLSQWRGYTQMGNGVALKFKREELDMRAKVLGYQLVRCSYGADPEFEQAARSWVHEFDTLILIDDLRASHESESRYLALAARYKDDAFRHESEWRLVSKRINYPREFAGGGQDKLSEAAELSFRVGRAVLIPYTEFPIGPLQDSDHDRWILDGLIVGPSPTPLISKRSIESVLRKFKIYLPSGVENSGIPYRHI